MELLYVGIAPDKPRAGKPPSKRPSNLRKRIANQHLADRLASSTLRRALAAFLWQEHEWAPTFPRKVEIPPASNRELTAWMKQNLSVAWVAHAEPWKVEAGVIRTMRPPLNWDHNAEHEFRNELRAAGRAFRETGKQATTEGR